MFEPKPIMSLGEGLKVFEKEAGFDSAVFIDIASRNNPNKLEYYLKYVSFAHKYDLSEVPVLVYSHPGGTFRPISQNPARKEILPKIENPDKYIGTKENWESDAIIVTL